MCLPQSNQEDIKIEGVRECPIKIEASFAPVRFKKDFASTPRNIPLCAIQVADFQTTSTNQEI